MELFECAIFFSRIESGKLEIIEGQYEEKEKYDQLVEMVQELNQVVSDKNERIRELNELKDQAYEQGRDCILCNAEKLSALFGKSSSALLIEDLFSSMIPASLADIFGQASS